MLLALHSEDATFLMRHSCPASPRAAYSQLSGVHLHTHSNNSRFFESVCRALHDAVNQTPPQPPLRPLHPSLPLLLLQKRRNHLFITPGILKQNFWLILIHRNEEILLDTQLWPNGATFSFPIWLCTQSSLSLSHFHSSGGSLTKVIAVTFCKHLQSASVFGKCLTPGLSQMVHFGGRRLAFYTLHIITQVFDKVMEIQSQSWGFISPLTSPSSAAVTWQIYYDSVLRAIMSHSVITETLAAALRGWWIGPVAWWWDSWKPLIDVTWCNAMYGRGVTLRIKAAAQPLT